MRRQVAWALTISSFGLAASPAVARTSCGSGIERALHRTEPLPETPGKAALMEQIQRAQIALHEGDESDCADELSTATDVLDRIDSARRAGTSGHP